jgi:predicted nucleic acid-binding protein
MKPSSLPAVAVNDATILIDVLEAGLLQAMLGLPIAFHVTDFVLAEILRPEQRSVLDAAVTQGLLTVDSLEPADVEAVADLAAELPALSFQDGSCLFLAQRLRAALLTGDGALRKAAAAAGLRVHGALWILDTLILEGRIDHVRATAALQGMLAAGARLPAPECERRLQQWLVA